MGESNEEESTQQIAWNDERDESDLGVKFLQPRANKGEFVEIQCYSYRTESGRHGGAFGCGNLP